MVNLDDLEKCYYRFNWLEGKVFFARIIRPECKCDASKQYVIFKGRIELWSHTGLGTKMTNNYCRLENLLEIAEHGGEGFTETILDRNELYSILKRAMALTKLEDKCQDIEGKFKRLLRKAEKNKFESIVNNTYDLLNNADRFIVRIERPKYEREIGNNNTDTFDFIRVRITLPADKRISLQELRVGVKKNYNIICNRALERINGDNRFQRYKVAINHLKLSKMTIISSIRQLELLFELKDELRNLEINQAK